MRIIAVQRGLEQLKELLSERGYQTVFTDEIAGPLYAFIYYEETNGDSYSAMSSVLNNSFTNVSDHGSNGILLLNAKSRSTDEIVSILERRTYSPLF